MSSITYPLPSNTWAATTTVNYTYDNAGLLTKVTDFNGNAITIASTTDGLPNSVSLGSTSDTISTTYDNTDTPSAVALKNASSTLQSVTYTESPAGTILNEADTPTSSQSPAVYTYDAKSRVTSMTPGTGSQLTYGFDTSDQKTGSQLGARQRRRSRAGGQRRRPPLDVIVARTGQTSGERMEDLRTAVSRRAGT